MRLYIKIEKKFREKLRKLECQAVIDYWFCFKDFIIELSLETVDEVEGFGVAFEALNYHGEFTFHFALLLSIQQNGDYSHMEQVYCEFKVGSEVPYSSVSANEDLWLANGYTLAEVFEHVENLESFKKLSTVKGIEPNVWGIQI